MTQFTSQWKPLRLLADNHTGNLKIYCKLKNYIGIAPTFPKSQFNFVGHKFKQLFVNASNYGVLGLSRGRDHLLVSRATDDGTVLSVLELYMAMSTL